MDLSKLTPAPWMVGRVPRDEEPDTYLIGSEASFWGRIVGSPGRYAETDAAFIALARNAFDGDPEALAWWDANRKRPAAACRREDEEHKPYRSQL